MRGVAPAICFTGSRGRSRPLPRRSWARNSENETEFYYIAFVIAEHEILLALIRKVRTLHGNVQAEKADILGARVV